MLKKILIGIACLIIAFVIVVAMQPAQFRVVRSIAIAAPPPAVFAHVNDFHQWDAWSPWAKLDSAVKNTFEGAPAGKGAMFMWSGNNKVGAGKMTITESRPNELIRIDLQFLKPFKSESITEFTFAPQGNQTLVTWSMFGQNNFLSKAFCLFANMDKMVGGDFEKGLAQIKSIAELPAKP